MGPAFLLFGWDGATGREGGQDTQGADKAPIRSRPPDRLVRAEGYDCEPTMDEVLARVALDISGRPWLVWHAGFTQERLGEMDTELFQHWFHSIAQAAGITLHVELLYGENNHHIIEGIFKGFARAMRQAVELDPRKAGAVPSTKGQLGG